MANRAPISKAVVRWWIAVGVVVSVWVVVRLWRYFDTVDSNEGDRQLSDCLGTLERPGCGSESRGGPYQLILFMVMMAAFAFIAWRVWRSARQARAGGVREPSSGPDETIDPA